MKTESDVTINGSTAFRAVKDITFGSVSGMASKVFEHPFDLTKVRLQAQVLDSEARFNGPMDCLVKTWKYEGLKGLFRGLPAPVVGAMGEIATLFLSYSEIQDLIRRMNHQSPDSTLTIPQLAVAGAGAGAVTSFILTPVELVKCKMQVQMIVPVAERQLVGPIGVLTSVIRNTGFRGLWLGHTGTLLRESGGGSAWFATKEFVASLLLRHRLSKDKGHAVSLTSAKSTQLHSWESALSGACAGAMFNFVMFPADTVKSTMQTEEELRPVKVNPGGKSPAKSSFLGTFQALYRAQGVKGLYAGCGITVARSIPSSAIIFLIYDGLNKYFG
jgi:ornithine carrier protein